MFRAPSGGGEFIGDAPAHSLALLLRRLIIYANLSNAYQDCVIPTVELELRAQVLTSLCTFDEHEGKRLINRQTHQNVNLHFWIP